MIQNIKVDTIYYLSNSDFEMEFNLCGCCKMRMLTDKAENPKNFVGLLSRAVSRSQVIICCGKLFSDDGLIKIVAKAIKRPLTTVDNAAYGIVDNNEIEIISGAVPLVNSDGCFCGCIAESGPQSIILLTDNKAIRKTVMKQLIHPYIEELSIIKNTQTSDNDAENNESDELTTTPESAEQTPALADTQVIDDNLTEDESNADEIADETAWEEPAEEFLDSDSNTELAESDETIVSDIQPEESEKIEEETGEESAVLENDIQTDDEQTVASENQKDDTVEKFVLPEVIVDEGVETTPDTFIDASEINSGFELYLEPERVKYSKKSHYALNYVPSESDKEFISESSDNNFFEKETDKKVLNLPILIVAIILLVALAALAYLLIFVPMNSNFAFSEYIKNIFSVSVNLKPLL